MADACNRPLKVPETYKNYVDKHQFLNLFQRMYEELLILEPEDPLQFLSEFLTSEDSNPDKPKIIINGGSRSCEKQAATMLALKTRGVVLYRQELISAAVSTSPEVDQFFQTRPGAHITPVLMIQIVIDRIQKDDCVDFGWILVGVPADREEAICLQEAGVLADHVLFLVHEDLADSSRSNPNSPRSSLLEHSHNSFSSRIRPVIQAYSTHARTFDMRVSNVESVLLDLLCFVCWRGREISQLPYRVLLLALPGSGCRTQANIVARQYSLVHVDCRLLISQHVKKKSQEGVEAEYYIRRGMDIPDYLVANIVQSRLSSDECRQRGWVLTGYPRNIYQAVLMMDQQIFPNRIIHMQTTAQVVVDRMTSRRFDPASGGQVTVTADDPLPDEVMTHLRRHPRDDPGQVIDRVLTRERQLSAVISFLGKYIQTIDGGLGLAEVAERIEKVLITRVPKRPE